jgi:amino-acid N-acetyltransferase
VLKDAFAVRPADAGDLEQVRRLLHECGLPLEGLDAHFGSAYAVAHAGARIVGAAGIEVWGRCGLLRSVVVDLPWRSRGLAAGLVRDRLSWAEHQRLLGVYLLTTTAEGYFRRFGFEGIERTRVPQDLRASAEFAGACPSSAAVMVLSLAGAFSQPQSIAGPGR